MDSTRLNFLSLQSRIGEEKKGENSSPADVTIHVHEKNKVVPMDDQSRPVEIIPKGRNKLKLILLCLHQALLIACSIVLPIIFIPECGVKQTWTPHIIMLIIVVPFLLLETLLLFRNRNYKRSYEIVLNSIQQEYEDKSYLKMMFLYAWTFFWRVVAPVAFTGLAISDFYLDVCFVVLTWKTKEYALAYIATATLLISSLPKMYGLFCLIKYTIQMRYEGDQMNTTVKLLELEIETLHYPSSEYTGEMLLKWTTGIWKFLSEDLIQCILQFYYVNFNSCAKQSSGTLLYVSIAFSISTSGFVMLFGIYKLIWLWLLPRTRRKILEVNPDGVIKIKYTGDTDRVFFKVDSKLLHDFTLPHKTFRLKCNYLSLPGMIDLMNAYVPLSKAKPQVTFSLRLDLYTGGNDFLSALKLNEKAKENNAYEHILEWRILKDYYMQYIHPVKDSLEAPVLKHLIKKVRGSFSLSQLAEFIIKDDNFSGVIEGLRESRQFSSFEICKGIGTRILKDQDIIEVLAALRYNDSIQALYFKSGNLSENIIKELSHTITMQHNLIDLHLCSNEIGDEGIIAVCEGIKGNISFRLLDVENDVFKESGIQALTAIINPPSSLNTLRLCNVKLTAENSKVLFTPLAANKSISCFDISDNQIGDEGADHLARALTDKKNLAELIIKKNNIGGNGIGLIAERLAFSSFLNVFDNTGNKIGSSGGKAMAEIFEKTTSITIANFDGNDIGGSGAGYIFSSLVKNKSITKLILSSCKITSACGKALEEAIKRNITLEILDLEDNELGNEGAKLLGDGLLMNSTLKKLKLGNNSITAYGGTAIAEACKSKIVALTHLNMMCNKIDNKVCTIFAEALLTNEILEVLNLSQTGLGTECANTLGKALQINQHLKELYIGKNDVNDEGAVQIAKGLESNKALTLISMESNKIGDEGATALACALAKNKSLTGMILNGNDIGFQGGKEIYAAASGNKQLTCLGLANSSKDLQEMTQLREILGKRFKESEKKDQGEFKKSEWGSINADMLVKGLRKNRYIENVDLSNLFFSIDEWEKIIEQVQKDKYIATLNLNQTNIQLEQLDKIIRGNSLSEISLANLQLNHEGAKSIASAMKQSNLITTLKLFNNALQDEGATILAQALATTSCLVILDLRFNEIGDIGGKALGDALKQNNSLTSLDLGNNQLSSGAAISLAEALKVNKSLQKLSLTSRTNTSNHIGVRGAVAFADALKVNETLRILNLRGNDSTQEGILALGSALSVNKGLHKLVLRENQVTKEGAEAIAKGLKSNKSLRILSIKTNTIGDDGAKYFSEALQENIHLRTLKLNNNSIGDTGGEYLISGLKLNEKLKVLTLDMNNLSFDTISKLLEVFSSHKSLERLDIKSIKIGPTAEEKIKELPSWKKVNWTSYVNK